MDRDTLLCELTLDGRREAVLALVSIDEVARQWVVYTARDTLNDDDEDPQHWPLWFRYQCLRDHDDCQEFLVALTNAPGADTVAHVIGADLMEDTLRFDEAGLTWIEHHAASNPTFQAALRSARIPSAIPEHVHVRLHQAAGHPPERWGKYDP